VALSCIGVARERRTYLHGGLLARVPDAQLLVVGRRGEQRAVVVPRETRRVAANSDREACGLVLDIPNLEVTITVVEMMASSRTSVSAMHRQLERRSSSSSSSIA